MLPSRLTGIDLEDIAAMPSDHQLMTEQALNQALAKTFLTEACTPIQTHRSTQQVPKTPSPPGAKPDTRTESPPAKSSSAPLPAVLV